MPTVTSSNPPVLATVESVSNLFGWSDQWWLWVDQVGILVGLIMIVLSVGGAVYAYFSREHIRQWLWRNRFPSPQELDDTQRQWDGLLFTVSRSELPQWVMTCIKPRFLALLATDETRDAADRLRSYAVARGIDQQPLMLLSDPDDPQEARRRSAELIDKLRRAGATEIAVDITGGKRPTSVGAFMAAEEAGVTSLYVSAPFVNGAPDTSRAVIKSLSGPHSR